MSPQTSHNNLKCRIYNSLSGAKCTCSENHELVLTKSGSRKRKDFAGSPQETDDSDKTPEPKKAKGHEKERKDCQNQMESPQNIEQAKRESEIETLRNQNAELRIELENLQSRYAKQQTELDRLKNDSLLAQKPSPVLVGLGIHCSPSRNTNVIFGAGPEIVDEYLLSFTDLFTEDWDGELESL